MQCLRDVSSFSSDMRLGGLPPELPHSFKSAFPLLPYRRIGHSPHHGDASIYSVLNPGTPGQLHHLADLVLVPVAGLSVSHEPQIDEAVQCDPRSLVSGLVALGKHLQCLCQTVYIIPKPCHVPYGLQRR